MPPLESYSGWYGRATDDKPQIEPKKRYYFICEGQNTERWYFERFIDLRNEFNISNLIGIIYLEKKGNFSGCSDPQSLFSLATQVANDGKYDFDKDFDKIIIIFDVDIYVTGQRSWCQYVNLIRNASDEFLFG